MYVYLQPGGGFNDNLVQISKTINYCKKYKRILLLDTANSTYKINFSDYFTFDADLEIIYDIKEIKKICNQKKYTVYPKFAESRLNDVIDGISISTYEEQNKFSLPNNPKEDIILYIQCGSGDGFSLFSKIKLTKKTIDYCKSKYMSLPTCYTSLQIRNTDYKCDIQKLHKENMQKIEQSKHIYLATDDKSTLTYFQEKNKNIINFTTFPENNYRNLHKSDISGDIKILNMLADILILAMSDQIISNSIGGFIHLCRKCFENKNIVKKIYNL